MINSAWDGRKCVEALEALEAVEEAVEAGSTLWKPSTLLLRVFDEPNKSSITFLPAPHHHMYLVLTSIHYCQLIIDRTMIQSSISTDYWLHCYYCSYFLIRF